MRDIWEAFVEPWIEILWRDKDADTLFARWTVYGNGTIMLSMSVIMFHNHIKLLVFSPFLVALICMILCVSNGQQMGWYLSKKFGKKGMEIYSGEASRFRTEQMEEIMHSPKKAALAVGLTSLISWSCFSFVTFLAGLFK